MITNGFTKFPNHLWGSSLTAGAKLTYAAIARFAWGSSTTAWPSQDTLSSMTGYSVRTIRRYTKELKQAKLIGVDRETWQGNRYHLLRADAVTAEEDRMADESGQNGLLTQDTVSSKEDTMNRSTTYQDTQTKDIDSSDTVSDGSVEGVEEVVEGGAKSLISSIYSTPAGGRGQDEIDDNPGVPGREENQRSPLFDETPSLTEEEREAWRNDPRNSYWVEEKS